MSFFFLFSAFETYKQIFCQTRTHQPQYPMSIVNLISSLTYSYFYYLLRKQYSSASSFVISHYHCKSCSNCWTHCFCFFFKKKPSFYDGKRLKKHWLAEKIIGDTPKENKTAGQCYICKCFQFSHSQAMPPYYLSFLSSNF